MKKRLVKPSLFLELIDFLLALSVGANRGFNPSSWRTLKLLKNLMIATLYSLSLLVGHCVVQSIFILVSFLDWSSCRQAPSSSCDRIYIFFSFKLTISSKPHFFETISKRLLNSSPRFSTLPHFSKSSRVSNSLDFHIKTNLTPLVVMIKPPVFAKNNKEY